MSWQPDPEVCGRAGHAWDENGKCADCPATTADVEPGRPGQPGPRWMEPLAERRARDYAWLLAVGGLTLENAAGRMGVGERTMERYRRNVIELAAADRGDPVLAAAAAACRRRDEVPPAGPDRQCGTAGPPRRPDLYVYGRSDPRLRPLVPEEA